MSLNCKQLKQRYEDLIMAKDMFVGLLEKSQKDSDFVNLKKNRAIFERYKDDVREALKYPGIIFSHLSKLVRDSGDHLTDFKYIHILPDGGIAGVITEHPRGTFLFWNSEKFMSINPAFDTAIESIKNFVVKKDGGFFGVLINFRGEQRLFNGRNFPKSIDGIDFDSIEDFCLQPNGMITGKMVKNGEVFPFCDNKLLSLFPDTVVYHDINFLHIGKEGKWSGAVEIGTKKLPFVGENIMEKMDGKDIEDSQNIHTQPNGNLAGRVKLEGVFYPFQGEEVLYEIEGREVLGTEYVYTAPNGELVGTVYIKEGKNKMLYMFRGDKLVDEISGQKFLVLQWVKCDKKGRFYGSAYVGGKLQLFYDDTLFDKISNRDIFDVREVFLLEDGSLSGLAGNRRGGY